MPCEKFSFQDLTSGRCFGYPLKWVAVALVAGVVVAILISNAFGAFSAADVKKESEVDDEKNVTFRIVGRNEWKARVPLHRPEPLLHPMQFIIILHTGGRKCSSLVQCGKLLREIQQYQVQNCGLWDIAPNFLIGGDGRAYEGRGWDFTGIFVTRFNLKGIGISFIGNFDEELPTDVQMSAYNQLILEGIRLNKITDRQRVMAQRQFVNNTRSPGDAFYEHMKKTWENWIIEP